MKKRLNEISKKLTDLESILLSSNKVPKQLKQMNETIETLFDLCFKNEECIHFYFEKEIPTLIKSSITNNFDLLCIFLPYLLNYHFQSDYILINKETISLLEITSIEILSNLQEFKTKFLLSPNEQNYSFIVFSIKFVSACLVNFKNNMNFKFLLSNIYEGLNKNLHSIISLLVIFDQRIYEREIKCLLRESTLFSISLVNTQEINYESIVFCLKEYYEMIKNININNYLNDCKIINNCYYRELSSKSIKEQELNNLLICDFEYYCLFVDKLLLNIDLKNKSKLLKLIETNFLAEIQKDIFIIRGIIMNINSNQKLSKLNIQRLIQIFKILTGVNLLNIKSLKLKHILYNFIFDDVDGKDVLLDFFTKLFQYKKYYYPISTDTLSINSSLKKSIKSISSINIENNNVLLDVKINLIIYLTSVIDLDPASFTNISYYYFNNYQLDDSIVDNKDGRIDIINFIMKNELTCFSKEIDIDSIVDYGIYTEFINKYNSLLVNTTMTNHSNIRIEEGKNLTIRNIEEKEEEKSILNTINSSINIKTQSNILATILGEQIEDESDTLNTFSSTNIKNKLISSILNRVLTFTENPYKENLFLLDLVTKILFANNYNNKISYSLSSTFALQFIFTFLSNVKNKIILYLKQLNLSIEEVNEILKEKINNSDFKPKISKYYPLTVIENDNFLNNIMLYNEFSLRVLGIIQENMIFKEINNIHESY